MPPLPPYQKINGKLNITFCPFQVQPIIFLFIPVSFWLISVFSGTILVHSTSFRLFWAYSGTFRSVPLSGAIVAYSGVTLVSFHFIAVSFRLVPVYSGTILVHSVSFRRHSALFRYIPVYSGIFRSVPFRSCV